MLCQHSRRCSTGELTMTFRTSRQSGRRQSESMLAFKVCPETRDILEPARPASSKRLTKCLTTTRSNTCSTIYDKEGMTQKNKSGTPLTRTCDTTHMSATVLKRDDITRSRVARSPIEEWKEKAALEKERQRRELDELVDSLPIPVRPGRRNTLGTGSCPFSQMVKSDDSSNVFRKSDHSGHVNSKNNEPCRPLDVDKDATLCPGSGLKSGHCKSTHRARVGNSLVHAVTRAIQSPSRDDCWNSVMCANSSGPSSQEVSSDEDIPPLIHHGHTTYPSPLTGQYTWSSSKGSAITSEPRTQITNGISVSPNVPHDTGDTCSDTDSHKLSDTKQVSVNGKIQHSNDFGFSPRSLKVGVVGCPVIRGICHSHTNSAWTPQTSCTDILTNLDHNGSCMRPYLRTRSNTISTAHSHARSRSSCDCLPQRRHSASGKLSQCCSDSRQPLGSRRFSESEADLMSFSSVSDIHTCGKTVDGNLDTVNRNLLDMSLPELHYKSLLDTDLKMNSPPRTSAPSVA